MPSDYGSGVGTVGHNGVPRTTTLLTWPTWRITQNFSREGGYQMLTPEEKAAARLGDPSILMAGVVVWGLDGAT